MRFARRSTTGYYIPQLDLSAYGIGLQDQLTNSSLWTLVHRTPEALNITSDSTIDSIDNETGVSTYYRVTPRTLTACFSQIEYDGFTLLSGGGAGHDSFFSCGGGVACRHTGNTWPVISGYAADWLGDGFSGTIVWSWKVYRYEQSGLSTAIQTLDSGSLLVAPVTGDQLRLECVSNVITLKINGSVVSSTTDTSIAAPTSGYVGIFGADVAQNGGSTIHMKNWRGGSLLPPPITQQERRGSGYYFGAR